MSQLGAYEAGLTDDPGCWVQPIEVYWSPRLDPRSPEYDPEFVVQAEWEEPGPDRDGPDLEPGGVSGSVRWMYAESGNRAAGAMNAAPRGRIA